MTLLVPLIETREQIVAVRQLTICSHIALIVGMNWLVIDQGVFVSGDTRQWFDTGNQVVVLIDILPALKGEDSRPRWDIKVRG